MNARASINLNQKYYEEAYNDWLQHRNFYYRHQRISGIAMVALGIILLCAFALKILPIIMITVGMWEFTDSSYRRRSWISTRLENKRSGETLDLIFSDEGIENRGSFADGKIHWTGLDECIDTPSGIVFSLEGLQVYIPKSAVEPRKAIPWIVEKAQNAGVKRTNNADSSVGYQ